MNEREETEILILRARSIIIISVCRFHFCVHNKRIFESRKHHTPAEHE